MTFPTFPVTACLLEPSFFSFQSAASNNSSTCTCHSLLQPVICCILWLYRYVETSAVSSWQHLSISRHSSKTNSELNYIFFKFKCSTRLFKDLHIWMEVQSYTVTYKSKFLLCEGPLCTWCTWPWPRQHQAVTPLEEGHHVIVPALHPTI